jgi:hypothetical protein
MKDALLILVGFVLGAGLLGWLLWSSLHQKLTSLEEGLHARFTALENRIAAKLGRAETVAKIEAQTIEKKL